MDAAREVAGGAPHELDQADVLAAWGGRADRGLDSDEAARRLEEHGPNEVRSAPPVPLWRRIAAQFRDPLVYLLLAAIVVSAVAWLVEGARGLPVDALVIAAILVANAAIGVVQEQKAADAIAALTRLTTASATVLRDGRRVTVPSAALVPGDLLLLAAGDAVGADARLLSATGLKVHEAALTGESVAVVKDPAPLPGPTPVGDRANMVFKGTAVVEGTGRAVVVVTGRATEVGAVAQLLTEAEEEPSPLKTELARISRTLGLLVLGIAAVVMLALALVTGASTRSDAVTILLTGVSLAVAAVPEGLVAILSLVLAMGASALARQQAIVKDLHSVETLGSASVICSDKTGTLTRNEMTLRTIVTASGTVELSGTGFVPEGAAAVRAATDSAAALAEARALLVGGVLANNAHLAREGGSWTVQGDPTEAAFLVAQHKLGGVTEEAASGDRVWEVPFTSERKLMSVLVRAGGAVRLISKGAPDILLTRCTRRRVGGADVALDAPARAAIEAVIEDLSSQGYRTLGVAERTLAPGTPVAPDRPDPALEHDLTFLGVVGIIDPPREEARLAVAQARRAGIRPIMITGDHPVAARRIGTDLGITGAEGRALTGAELDALDAAALADAVHEVNVFARVAPRHKLRIVDALQARGHTVAMTGDGVNDAPALKASDIGVAMGVTGTEVAKQAADMVLGDDNFATIVAAVRQGRVIYANIAKFLRYLLSSNLGEVVTIFLGVVLGVGVLGLTGPDGAFVVPLLATQILWINLITDSGPALAMGVDPEIDDVMVRPPRRRDARLLDRATWLSIGWVGLVMGAVSLLALDLHLPGGLIEGSESVAVARTAGFTTLVLAQLFNAFCARSATASAATGLFTNRWLWVAVGFGVVAQVAVVEVPWLQAAFGTAPLTPGQWAVCVALASVVLWVQEGAKLVARRRPAGRGPVGGRSGPG
nr:cation-translocating P-type ATPase [Propionibacterium sp.]